ncbi:hypothetical protein ACFLTH_07445 [Bacteroidota bacterium]
MENSIEFKILFRLFTVIIILPLQFVFPQSEESFLGQNPPGITPQLFAPEILSEVNFREYVYIPLPGEDALVFDQHADYGFPQGEIFISKIIDSAWTKPVLFGLFRNYEYVFLPTISPDGNKWFFTSDKLPVPKNVEGKIPHFYIEKTENGWSRPKYIGQHIHSSTTTDGTLYVMVEMSGFSRPAVRTFEEGKYSDYQFLEPAEYFRENDAHLVVDPFGEYIIFDSQTRPRIGECRLFISYKKDDGTWTEPASMGRYIAQKGAMAWISYDGKYIFFKAGTDVYWVSVEIVERIKTHIPDL